MRAASSFSPAGWSSGSIKSVATRATTPPRRKHSVPHIRTGSQSSGVPAGRYRSSVAAKTFDTSSRAARPGRLRRRRSSSAHSVSSSAGTGSSARRSRPQQPKRRARYPLRAVGHISTSTCPMIITSRSPRRRSSPRRSPASFAGSGECWPAGQITGWIAGSTTLRRTRS